MTLRILAPLTLCTSAALLAPLGLAACDAPAAAPSAGGDVDDFGENDVPPTRDEILAAASTSDADDVAAALVEVADEADAAALPLVLPLTRDEREEVRWHAAIALRAIGGDAARVELARLAADDPSELVREEAAR